MFTVPLEGGRVAEFSQRALVDAYLEMYSRAIGDPDTPEEEHPLIAAIRTSSDAKWRNCFADLLDPENLHASAEDLSVNPNESPY